MKRSILFAFCLAAASAAFAQVAPPVGKKVTSGFGPRSKEEQKAVQAVIQTQAPDEKIKACEELVTGFPKTDFKSFALELEAEAYQQKGDNTKAMVFAEQALEADPKNYDADNVLANILAATTRETDLDKDQKVAKADKYAHASLDLLATGERPPLYEKVSPEQWAKIKASGESLAYQALGNLALLKKNTDEAVAFFEKGIAANPDPVLMIRVGRALLAAKKPDDAITWFDKAINSPDVTAQIKGIATSDKARAMQAKGPSAAK